MANVIRAIDWQPGIEDNALLPDRLHKIFTGNGVKIANNNDACRVVDLVVPDYITDYDDRRINGHSGANVEGRDGWGASAWGVFQDVKFDTKVYTMGRHRSVAFRLFEEMQYSGNIGEWGTATTSNVTHGGNAYMQTATMLTEARKRWEAQTLGPDIDKYTLFAIANGHISGRWVQDNPDEIFSDSGTWVAQPGEVEGQPIPPRFAPIHAIEWDDANIPLMLQNIKVTWNNLWIPQDQRVILLDPFYEYRLLVALTGNGVPATDGAYQDIKNGSFTRLMGWDFDFTVPSNYWPRIWVDDNLNVVHSENADAAYDQLMISTDHTADGDKKLMLELADADRMNRTNFVKTIWNNTTKQFEKVVTNYPLGLPGAVDYFGPAMVIDDGIDNFSAAGQSYPWTEPGAGYGLPAKGVSDTGYPTDAHTTGPVLEKTGKAVRRQLIGMAVYRPAAQLSQEYSDMRTADGETRGKFTEMVYDVKYDAWVIEQYSHGILPIVDAEENTGTFAIPVKVIEEAETPVTPTVTAITATPDTVAIVTGQEASPVVTVTGTGDFDRGFTAYSSDTGVATIDDDGVIAGVAAGTATITYRANGDSSKTATVTVTVTARV